MKISLQWLQDFIELTQSDPQKISDVLTEKSAEVEEIIDLGKDFQNVVTGKILEISAHPDADRVRVTKIDVGDGTFRQIICGAQNIEVGQIVPVALVGAVLPGNFAIEARKMRGVMSEGMLCSGKELGITEDAQGIMILEEGLELGQPLAKVLGLDGITIDIDNTSITNRPDLFSHVGFAREFVGLGLGKPITNYKLQITNDVSGNADEELKKYPQKIQKEIEKISEEIPDVPLPVEFDIENPEICPARAEIVAENVSVAPSPQWMQSRLQECGIRPINNIVDISNFVMLETGMPLHIFDVETISGKKITMRESKKGEKVVTLDGIERELSAGVIIQEDEEKIFDLAGIMGGGNSEISDSTTRILVHIPIYDPIRIRKASLALGHRTDASTIYEKRVPNSSILPAMYRTLQLLAELCPEMKIISNIEFVEHIPTEKRILFLPFSIVNRVLGQNVEESEIKKILSSLDFSIESVTGEGMEVLIPGHRMGDISIAEDLVEEIARIHGFNTISESAPEMKMRPSPLSPIRKIRREVADYLVGQGFYEIMTFSFIGPDLLKMCGIEGDESYVEVANPLSADQSLMRQSLLPRLLEKSAENRRHQDNFNLFEIGKTFVRTSEESVAESVMLAGLSSGKSFFELKGYIEGLCSYLHFPLRLTQPKQLSDFASKGASLFIGKDCVGEISVLKKSLQKTFNLPEGTSFFSINLSQMAEFPRKHVLVKAAPKFPEIELDLSVLAEKNTLSSEVLRAVSRIDPLIVSAEIFEIFEGEGLPEGKKSVTLHFVFRAPDRTLGSTEADSLKEKILNTLEKKGYPFRF